MKQKIKIYLTNSRDIDTTINLTGISIDVVGAHIEREMVKIGQVGYFVKDEYFTTYYPPNQIKKIEVKRNL